MDMKVYHAVPLRLSMLLTRTENRNLTELVDGNLTKWDVPDVIEALAKRAKTEHRTVRGTFFEGTFEFRFYKSGEGDEFSRNIDCLSFWHSEFPATSNEYGNKLPENEEPVEFIVTSRFTALLFSTEGLARGGKFKLPSLSHSRLVVRRGLVEAQFVLNGQKATSVADAIIAVEGASGDARRWLEPVSTEIVECNLLGG